VHENTAYMEQIVSFKNNNGLDINLIAADPEEGLDELVSQIADGSLDYTILDENIAFIFKQIYPNLHISTPVSLSQNIAWAVKKDNTGLLDLLNAWEEKNRGSTKWNMIYNKYFKNKSGEMRSMQSNFDKIKTGELSSYDPLIQKYATQINWDWRLLTSLIRRESRFNKEAHSRFGAYGLMQVLPGTASQFGIQEHQLGIPEYNIMAGTRFIQWLEHYWSDKLPDTLDHKPFILASYNAGPGHVLDAMRLAEKNDLDPHIWYGNVETMLLYKSKPAYYKDPVVRHGYCRGKEPVFYVKDIYKYFEYYKVFTDEQSPEIPTTATASL
jgi:membrane-bound lytic murein transglycosylase F